MKAEKKEFWQLQRNMFSYGIGFIGILWNFILLFGISSGDAKSSMILGIIYYIGAYFLGRYLYNNGWVSADMEANNRFNPFVKQMRRKIGIPNKRKI